MVYKFSIPGPENFFNIDFFECRSHITVLFKILHKKKCHVTSDRVKSRSQSMGNLSAFGNITWAEDGH